MFRHLVARFAETALAVLIVVDGIVEILVAEVGPELVTEIELGIGHLPKEEIADAKLAARADKEVGIGIVASGQVAAEGLLGHIGGGKTALTGIVADGAQSLRHLPAGAVAERQNESHGGVAGGDIYTFLQTVAGLLGYAVQIAYGLQTDIVVHQGFGLILHGFDKEFHQAVDFLLRAIPILGAEGVEGEEFDT